MKTSEKDKARLLRKNDGLSVKKIAKLLNVSSSSVSLWVRDIALTEDQLARLGSRESLHKGNTIQSELARSKRIQFQAVGRKMTKESTPCFSFGVALFLAEGAKNKNAVIFVNSDARIVKFFFDFIQKNFKCRLDEWKVSVQYYDNGHISLEEILRYWLDLLGLPDQCLRKCLMKGRYYENKGDPKHPYGICRLVLHRTDIVQSLFGSANEFLSDKSDWGSL